MPSSDSARQEAIEVKPKNVRTAGTGSVIDPRPFKYPSTQEFASSKKENPSKVEHGIKKSRPGGERRKGHPFGCSCMKHPCTCGTKEAEKNEYGVRTMERN